MEQNDLQPLVQRLYEVQPGKREWRGGVDVSVLGLFLGGVFPAYVGEGDPFDRMMSLCSEENLDTHFITLFVVYWRPPSFSVVSRQRRELV